MSSQEPSTPQPDQVGSDQPGSSQSESMWGGEGVPVAPAANLPAAQTTSGNSIVALVLSIVSWAVCPIIFAIVALVFASKADKEIAAGQGRVGGSALVLAAKILSWINIGLFAALLVLGLLAVLFLTLAGVASN